MGECEVLMNLVRVGIWCWRGEMLAWNYVVGMTQTWVGGGARTRLKVLDEAPTCTKLVSRRGLRRPVGWRASTAGRGSMVHGIVIDSMRRPRSEEKAQAVESCLVESGLPVVW